MRKKIMAVLDGERGFVERLVAFAGQERGLPVTVYGFTEIEKLAEFCGKERVEILLLAKSLVSEETRRLPAGTVLCLTEERVKTWEGLPAVSRYQMARSLLAEALAVSGKERNGESAGILKRKVRTIGVYSPNGRCGKTSLLLALGRQMARVRPTLYFSLEEFSGLGALLRMRQSGYDEGEGLLVRGKGIRRPGLTAGRISSEAEKNALTGAAMETGQMAKETNLADLFFLLRQKNENLASAIAAAACSYGKLDVLPPAALAGELRDVSEEEWERFFDVLREKTGYEVLLVDVAGGGGHLRTLLAECDRIYVPEAEDLIGKAKLTEFRQTFLERDGNREVAESLCRVKLPAFTAEESRNFPEHLEWSGIGRVAKELLEKDPVFRL